MTIAETIKEYRVKLSLTQEQLGAMVNVSGQAVSKWETGENIPDTMTLKPLADALHISCDRLLCCDKIYEDELCLDVQRYIGKCAGARESGERLRRARLIQLQTHAGLFADENDTYFNQNISVFDPSESHSHATSDFGFTYTSNYASLPFFTCFIEPDGGFGSVLKPDDKIREFFKAFADGDVMRVFFGIYSEMNYDNSFDSGALAKMFGLDETKGAEIAEKLRGFGMLYAEEVNIDGRERMLYEPMGDIFPFIAVFALLYDIFRQDHNMGRMTASGRIAPYLRKSNA